MCRRNTSRKEDFCLRDGWRHCSPWVLLSTHSPASSLWPSLRAKRARCKRSRVPSVSPLPSSRMLFSVARTGWAPAAFGRLNAAGSPMLALLASSYGIVVALVLEKWAPKDAFVSILGAALVGLLLAWLVSLAAHVKFRQRLSVQQLAALPMRSPLGAWGSAVGFVLIILRSEEHTSELQSRVDLVC